jgi:predicted ATPase/class 3 adenylate cyclase/GAF domain-containing protein
MLNLPGYQILEQIHDSHKSRVYKGLRVKDNQPVILKLLKQDYPTPKDLSRYQQEFEILHSLNIESVVQAYALESYQNTLAIVLEDFGGISLSDYLQTQHFTVENFLPLGIKISEAIGQIHAAQIIHKDINPSNIVWNPDTNEIKIIDFGISSRIVISANGSKPTTTLEGTMIYMSPEQTGRMNRTVDYRTDFYSLGMTFYEMLTGKLPFPVTDLTDHIELVHCHIAKEPVAPNKINPDIPKALSDIILKLLAKTAEARYQSAWGLREDLARCLRELERHGTIAEFPLGTQDISEQFHMPQTIYGRELEINTLLAAFDRVVQGEKSLVILSGETGIGKSSLVQEVYQPMLQRQGYLLTGKFAPERGDPYTAIAQAFSGLIRQLLTESEAQLNHWQTKLQEVLGEQLPIMIAIVPELKLMFNQSPDVSEVEPENLTESNEFEPENPQNLSGDRIDRAFLCFLRVFCHPEHPIVIFLDEIHWANPAVLKLLELIMLDPAINHLLLILAYRQYETVETSEMPIAGFSRYLEILQQAQIKVEQIRLNPLTYEQITNLIAQTLQQHDEAVKSLAGIIFWKTAGIPCLVRQFLTTLYQEKLLTFEFNRPEGESLQKPRWTWDIEQVKNIEIPSDISELPVEQLRKLPEATQQVLHLAACLGNSFDLQTLSVIYEKSIRETFESIWPAIQEGFILPQSEMETIELEANEPFLLFENFKFSSHRIQQSACEMIEDPQVQKELYLKIGNFLKSQNLLNSNRQLFKIVENLNKAKDLIGDESARIELAELNLKAAKFTQEQKNYDLAKEYLTNARFLLNPDTCWESHYDLAIALYKMLAEIELATDQFARAEDYLYLLIEKLKSPLEKSEIAYQIIEHYLQVYKNKQAIVLGRKALRWLGVEIPNSEADIAQKIQKEVQRLNKYLSNCSIQNLLAQEPPMNLAKHQLIKLLTSLSLAAKEISQNLFDLLIVKAVNLSVQYGNLPESAYAYAAYSIMVAAVFEDDRSSEEFGELAFSLSKKFNHPVSQCLTYNLYANNISIWFKPISFANSINSHGYEIARKAGELGLARDLLMNQCVNYFYQGKFLAHLMADVSHCKELNPSRYNRWTTEAILASEIAIANLTGQTADKFTFATKYYSESAYLNSDNHQQDLAGICLYKIYKMQILYLYEEYAQAMALAQDIENIIHYIRGSLANFEYIFFYCLILTASYKQVADSQQVNFLTQLTTYQKKLKKWVSNCPDNFRAKFLLVKAEIARINGNIVDAMNLYDYAIQLVQGHEYIQIRALADELAAKFWLEQKKEAFATLYLAKARACYQIWGAKRKVEDLELKYASLLPMNPEEKAKVIDQIKPSSTLSSPLISTLSRTTTYMSSNSEVAILDLATVMKASQAISEEIVLDKLLEKLMKILMENAGAQKGFLILTNQGKLLIEAEGSMVTDPVQESSLPELVIQVLQSIAVEDSETENPSLPRAIVNYVARTKENVVLHDATQIGKEFSSGEHDLSKADLYRQFANDPYLQKNQTKSILCAPLMSKGELYGIIYMENNLTPGAFTPDRLEMLNLLSSQAAISIENSRYYTEMAALNKAYERFVPRQFLHFLKKKSIVDVQLGDNVQQEMSVLFSDIRAFTTLSESLTPAENFKFINSYLSSMEPAIVENNGFIDKYIGDAIMALFPGGADDSVEAAISMLRRLSEYNQGRERAGYVPIEIGIGINTGDLMLGTVGGNSRMDSTVISDAVNLASRLEGLTKIYGVSLLISHQTFLRLSNATNYNIRIIERLKVKGKSHEVAVFEVFDGDEPELREQKLMTSSLFEEALMLYYRKAYQEAEKLFQDCLRQCPKDRAIRVYLERCQSNL